MSKFYADRPDNILEALRFAAHVVNSGAFKHDITVVNNQVVYSNGAGLFRATFETRNFMDDRREAMADIAVGTIVRHRDGTMCRIEAIHENEPRYLLRGLNRQKYGWSSESQFSIATAAQAAEVSAAAPSAPE